MFKDKEMLKMEQKSKQYVIQIMAIITMVFGFSTFALAAALDLDAINNNPAALEYEEADNNVSDGEPAEAIEENISEEVAVVSEEAGSDTQNRAPAEEESEDASKFGEPAEGISEIDFKEKIHDKELTWTVEKDNNGNRRIFLSGQCQINLNYKLEEHAKLSEIRSSNNEDQQPTIALMLKEDTSASASASACAQNGWLENNNNFSVEIPKNFSGKVELCFLQPRANNDTDVIAQYNKCDDISLRQSKNGHSNGILGEGSYIIGEKELEEKQQLRAKAYQIEDSLDELWSQCSEYKFSEVESTISDLNRLLSELDLDEIKGDKIKGSLINALKKEIEDKLGDSNEIANIRNLSSLYEDHEDKISELEESDKKDILELFDVRAAEIAEDIKDEDVDKKYAENVIDTVEDVTEFRRKLGIVDNRKELAEERSAILKDAAEIAYNDGQQIEVTEKLLKEAEKGVSSEEKLLIANARVNIYEDLYTRCLKGKFENGFETCEHYAKKSEEAWSNMIRKAKVAKLGDDKIEKLETEKSRRFEQPYQVAGLQGGIVTLSGSYQYNNWQQYVAFLQRQAQAQQVQGMAFNMYGNPMVALPMNQNLLMGMGGAQGRFPATGINPRAPMRPTAGAPSIQF